MGNWRTTLNSCECWKRVEKYLCTYGLMVLNYQTQNAAFSRFIYISQHKNAKAYPIIDLWRTIFGGAHSNLISRIFATCCWCVVRQHMMPHIRFAVIRNNSFIKILYLSHLLFIFRINGVVGWRRFLFHRNLACVAYQSVDMRCRFTCVSLAI